MLTYIYLIAITAEAMSGALAAGRRNMDLFGVALIAFITALGGGTVRDIMCNRTPQVLRHELYASVSMVVAVVYLLLMSQGVPDEINTPVSFCFGLALRLAAIRWKLSLPVFSYSPGRWGD